MNFLQEPQKNQDDQLQEIDLSEYFRIIKKEKKIIISLLFLGIMLGIFWFFIGPTKYIGSSLVEVGRSKEDLIQTLEKIKSNLSDKEIKSSVVVLENTSLIEIEVEDKDYNKVENVLDEINKDILSYYFEESQELLTALVERENFLKEKIKNIKEDVSFLMNRGLDIVPLKIKIYDMEADIMDTKAEMSKISTAEIVEGPNIVEKKQSYLVIIFSAILGLFIGFVLAFLKDYWQKNKKIL